MSFGGIFFTNRGKALQAKVQTGAELAFTKLAVGDGNLAGQAIADMTALIHPVKNLAINRLKTLPGGKAEVGGVLTNQGLAAGFYWRELGVFAQDPDLGEILYCYGNAGALAEYIPSPGGAEILEKQVNVVTLIGNATNITASIDESLVYATQQDIEDLQEQIDNIDVAGTPMTVDQSQAPTTPGNGTVSQLFSWLANRIKAITGKANWWDAPSTTLEGAASHALATAPHNATSGATANRLMLRDANGRAKVVAPSASDDIARKDTVDAVQGNLTTHLADNVKHITAGERSTWNGKLDASSVSDLKQMMFMNPGFLSGSDGDATISSNQAIPRQVMFYNNLTINSGITLSTIAGSPCVIFVKGTLALNGNISADGNGKAAAAGSAGQGAGGNGGGILLIFAKNITGSGKISANGADGGNGSTPTGVLNWGSTVETPLCFGYTAALLILNMAKSFLMPLNYSTDKGGSAGTQGSAVNSTAANNQYFGGGLGGNGTYGSGGTGGLLGVTGGLPNTGGGGGGGAGVIILASPNTIPAISVQAKGGKGGNGGGDFGQGGGGGGGGIVHLIAPSSLATIAVSGGAIGIYVGSQATAPTTGGAGISFLTVA